MRAFPLSNSVAGCTLDKLTVADLQNIGAFNRKKAARGLLFYCAKKESGAADQA
ncbi:hypothetical protein [Mixta gaviniae]|uniref:hypothetical protein n=1 Tax=Mixta gaviniae TaxID=665914 RepID=UPI00142DE6EC|nr:hypothetical protein [Mixta gaviniae]